MSLTKPPSAQVLSTQRLRMCQTWNADRAHQIQAGKARAALRTPEQQRIYGGCAWLAFMTRFRARIGQAPYTTEGLKYIGFDDICVMGTPLPAHLARLVYEAWRSGDLRDAGAMLDDPPPAPGSLWAVSAESTEPPAQATRTAETLPSAAEPRAHSTRRYLSAQAKQII